MKAFIKSGILSEDGGRVGTKTGTPQGGILSPLLANIALSVLDDHFAEVRKSWGSDSSRCALRRLLFQILTEREERAAVAVATNAPFSEWSKTFTDPHRRRRRITCRAHIIQTGTVSYRLTNR